MTANYAGNESTFSFTGGITHSKTDMHSPASLSLLNESLFCFSDEQQIRHRGTVAVHMSCLFFELKTVLHLYLPWDVRMCVCVCLLLCVIVDACAFVASLSLKPASFALLYPTPILHLPNDHAYAFFSSVLIDQFRPTTCTVATRRVGMIGIRKLNSKLRPMPTPFVFAIKHVPLALPECL